MIQGTMTVQGTAFSVAGSTFSVAGGSVTLGVRLNTATEGIRWADGTISTTASAGGGGTLPNTFTSSVTFLSSVTAGPATYGTNAVILRGAYINSWTLVASTNPSGASSTTFTGLSPDVTYRLHWKLKKLASDGTYQLRFNGDTGARYYYSTVNENASSLGGSNSYGATVIQLTRSTAGSGYYSIGDEIFSSMPGDSTQVYGHGEICQLASDVVANWNSGAWAWKGLTSISSMTFMPSAGTYAGIIELWAESKPSGASP